MTFSSDALLLATGGGNSDCTVHIWDASGSNESHLKTLNGHPSGISLISFSSDKSKVACATEDRHVNIWDSHNWESIAVLGPHDVDYQAEKADLRFNNDGTELIIHTCLRTLSWNIENGDKEEKFDKGSIVQQGDDKQHRFSVSPSSSSSDTSQWSLVFNGNGQQKKVVIPDENALKDGPFAYCRDRVAIAGVDGSFLLLDVSRVLEGIDLPNVSHKSMDWPLDSR